jgi:diguanylate cyclase (GGDEF)-like protein
MLLDLDGFKHVNDSLGHPAGDEVLKKVSARLQNILRRSDSLARLGGDEFTLVVDDMEDPSDLSTVAENLLENFKKPFHIQETEIYLGASIGIAVYPLDGDTPEKLVQNADLAMYKSKEQGKNTFNHYTSGLNAQARQRLQLESDLRRALSEKDLQVYFQPKVSLDDWRIYSAEALVRWPDGNGGFRNTSEFIHFAESTGLIIPLDLFVFEAACRTAKSWVENTNDALRLSVNVSTRHFRRGDLAENVAEVLEATGFPADRLNLEITETALMQNLQSASSILIELNSMGVTFSLDDFGTGYSSLYYLKTLPVQSLKIDKRFISLIESQSADGDIFVKTILSMADNLGLNTVAEGVETRKQLDILTKLGCQRAQGYLFSPAVSAGEFERLLSKGRIVPGRDKITHLEKKPANVFKIK